MSDDRSKRKTGPPTKSLKSALDLCNVIDKKKKGEISRTNFDKIAKMCGFVGTLADNSEAESRFAELVRAHTY